MGLATAATQRYLQEQKENLDDIINRKGGDISGFLTELEDHLAEMMTDDPSASGCIMSQLINDREAPQKLRQLALDRLLLEVEVIRAELENAKANGTLSSSADAESLALRIMSMQLGIAQMTLIETDLPKIRNSIKGALVDIIE